MLSETIVNEHLYLCHLLVLSSSKISSLCLPREILYSVTLLMRAHVTGFLTPEDGTDRLSRNVGKELPLLVA